MTQGARVPGRRAVPAGAGAGRGSHAALTARPAGCAQAGLRGSLIAASGNPALQGGAHALGNLGLQLDHRLLRVVGVVVGEDDRGPALAGGLSASRGSVPKHVERGVAQATGAQRVGQRRFVDDPATGGVDDDRRRLHRREPRLVDHAARLGRQRRMDRHEVRRGKQILYARRLRAGGPHLGGVHVRVVRQHPSQAQPGQLAVHRARDSARSPAGRTSLPRMR